MISQLIKNIRHCCYDLGNDLNPRPVFSYLNPFKSDTEVEARMQLLAELFHKQVFHGLHSIIYKDTDTRTHDLPSVACK